MFRNISIGEKLWSFELGDCKVTKINKEEKYFIATNGRENYCYSFSGIHGYNIRPTIFWSEPKIEIPKKPFNLKEFLKENLEPKEFIKHKDNYFLYWNHDCEIFDYNRNIDYESSQPYFERKNLDEVVVTLNDNKVTIEQLKQAFKELGWL